jgi:hypothetical protein
VELHLYGANFPKKFNEFDPDETGIRRMGLMKSLKLMIRYKMLLAPILFGAGVKGWVLVFNNFKENH